MVRLSWPAADLQNVERGRPAASILLLSEYTTAASCNHQRALLLVLVKDIWDVETDC
jgi:hypothetical protein